MRKQKKHMNFTILKDNIYYILPEKTRRKKKYIFMYI